MDPTTPCGDSGKKCVEESCSIEDREGPVRLSYAQVAQRTSAGAGIDKATLPPASCTPASPGDDGKRVDSARGSRDTKEGQRLPKSLASGGPSPRNTTAYKRPPFPRRDRVFSNGGSTNRTGPSNGGSSTETKN